MQIWLIRHGLTALSEAHKYQGVLDTPLSESGRAALLENDFAQTVYHSPLLRCRETAALLFPSAEKHSVAALREMDFGAFEGRGWWEMERDADYRDWVDGGCVGRCPGGEDRAEFSERVCNGFSELLEQARERNAENLVIVAHGGTQMAILDRWGDPGRNYYEWQTACGSGFVLSDVHWPERLDVIREVNFTR